MTLAQDWDAAVSALETLRDDADAKLDELRGGPAENGASYVEAAEKAANAALAALGGKPEVGARLKTAGL